MEHTRDSIRELIHDSQHELRVLKEQISDKLTSLRDFAIEVREAGCKSVTETVTADSGSINAKICEEHIEILTDVGVSACVKLLGDEPPELSGFIIHEIGTIRHFPRVIELLEKDFLVQVDHVLKCQSASDKEEDVDNDCE